MTPSHKLILLTLAAAAAALVLIAPWSAGQDRALVGMVATLNGQWVGRQAPSLALPDLEGQQHTLAEYRGQVVFLNFWGSFCAPCREEMPSMEALVRDYKERGMVMVAISLDPEAQDAREFMQTFMPGERSAMTVLHDPQGTSSQLYGTELLPETYIIDRQGRVVARFVNAYDWSRPEVRQLIEFLLTDTSSGAGRRLL
jgi:peroxiredoxin